MLSYRSAEEWRTRFGRELQNYFPREVFGMDYAVESYLEAAARRFIYSFDPCSYLYLSRSMDWFNVADGHHDLQHALAEIQLKSACVIGVDSDILFPLYQQKDIADGLTANGIETEFTELKSPLGHDAFLVDYNQFGPLVAAYFNRTWEAEGMAG
jgi:homoserine O-acetyltransferase